MRKMIFKPLAGVFAGVLLSLSGNVAFAQNEIQSLDQLLQMMKGSKISETKEHREREAEFQSKKNERASLLAKAKRIKAQEEARSKALEKKFAEQDLQLKARREQLDERLGSLKELFGHLSSAAGDFKSNIPNSLVSVQFPDRGDFTSDLIEKMNSETKLPTIEEIERLMFEIQRETLESGKVVKFTTDVRMPDGQAAKQEVVRVGNYGAVSNGEYLFFESGEGAGNVGYLFVPERQPPKLADAGSVQSATSGLTPFSIDPTLPLGGEIMKILIDRPDLAKRFEQGGLVGKIIIIGLGGIGVLLILWRLLALLAVSGKVKAQLKSKKARKNNPLGRVLKVAEDNPGIDGESLELKLEEAILKERPSIESGLNLIKIISMVAPLMGLLGTVVGMIQTFQAITDFGAGDPKLMAGGISAALVTTVCGLIVAIPTVLMHTVLSGMAKKVVHVLEEQSAGIIAEKAER